MLERIERIQGIGLLHDVNGKSHPFQKATLIYADNGRGKSTTTAILRSAAIDDAESINERRTLDGTIPPSVVLALSNGVKTEFAGGKWSKPLPEMLIFDGTFIEENVCSGGAVGPAHRKNLLQFALGSAAVAARKKEELATADASKATAALRQFTAQLAGYQGSFSLAAFERLAVVEDAEVRMVELQKRVATATIAEEILKRPVPRDIPLPQFDSAALFSILRVSLDNIEDDAEQLVRNHIATSRVHGLEGWISSGAAFDDGENCPYCAQDTSGLSLVRAYRTHFNAAYAKLKSQVAILQRGLEVRLGPQIIRTVVTALETVLAQRETWANDVELVLPNFDLQGAEAIMVALNEVLATLVEAKQQAPTSSIGGEADIYQVEQLWTGLLVLVESTNTQIRQCAASIETYKKNLAQERPGAIQIEIEKLLVSKRRFEPEVIALFKNVAVSRATEAACLAAKKKARDELDALMTSTLGNYEKAINSLLLKFGATFSIEKMDANFRGGSPRTEYGIKMRGKSVSLDAGVPRFTTALSDGDKRTLAFAFFVASSAADPTLNGKIIVIDDPMCSLDVNRKQHTKAVLRSLHAKANQLIVLAHDPFFIRDLRDELTPRDGNGQVQVLTLCHAGMGYTTIGKFDVDQACESKYYRNYRLIKEFCSGQLNDDRNVAMALRPFLEGHLHRRFPLLVPGDVMFGNAISIIKAAQAPNPLTYAHDLVQELTELNEYAGQFHHDTNQGNADSIPVIAEELRTHCERALHLAYSGQRRS